MPVSYSPDFRARAVRLVKESLDAADPPVTEWAAIKLVATRLNVGAETLRKWIRRSEVDSGQRPGITSVESAEMKRLRKENHELKMANEILMTASTFFASRLDQRLGK